MKPYSILGKGSNPVMWVLCRHTSPNLPTSTSTPLSGPCPFPLLPSRSSHIPARAQRPLGRGSPTVVLPSRLSGPRCRLPLSCRILIERAIPTEHTAPTQLYLLSSLPFLAGRLSPLLLPP